MVDTPTDWDELTALVARLDPSLTQELPTRARARNLPAIIRTLAVLVAWPGRLSDQTGWGPKHSHDHLQKIIGSLERLNQHLVNTKQMISERGAELHALSDNFTHENARLVQLVDRAFSRAQWRTRRLRLQIFYFIWRLRAVYAVCIGGAIWLIYTYRIAIIDSIVSLILWVTELIGPYDPYDSSVWPL